jgi:Sugar transferases involved in lipopolysaccharide synthesis
MTQEKDEKGNLLPDELRLTKFCKLLRSLSLDEIPELFNILHGDMSIVGPRPLPIIYLPFYTEEERRRHTVRPGLTGLAQVNGRNSISWEEKFRYDNRYIQNISFRNDVIIVLLTILKVIKRADIGQAEEAPISLHIQRQNNNKE